MSTTKEYEVIGLAGDYGEWCAATDNLEEVYHYAAQYLSDYEKIEVYEVSRKKILELRK